MTDRCNATVWKKDTYRRTGRTKSGFEMHYNRCRCSRRAAFGDLCWQHKRLADLGDAVIRYENDGGRPS